MAAGELLETRIVPASAAFNTGTGELTISGTAGGDSVLVAIGGSSTRVSVNNILLATLTNVGTNGTPGITDIAEITFTGAGGGQTLTITGNTPTLDEINFTGGASNLVVSANVTPLGGTLTVTAGGAALNLGHPNPAVTNDFVNVVGNLTITGVTGNLTDSGRVSVSGELDITATGDILLDVAGSNFGSLDLSATNISVVEAGTTLLEDIDATGTLSVTSSGAVTDGAGGVSAGATTITTGNSAASITLDNAANVFGVLTLTGGDITIVENAATDLGPVTASLGELNVTSAGAINDGAAISVVNGRATFSAGAAGIIDLSDFGHRFKSVSLLTAGNAEVNEADSTVLYTVDVDGNLTVSSLGSIEDIGSVLSAVPPATQAHSTILVGGDTVLTAGTLAVPASIILDSAFNNFDDDGSGDEVTFNGNVAGALANVTLVDSDAIDIGPSVITGNLKVTAGGVVTDDGAVTVPGRATIFAVGSNITLNQSTFGSLELRGADVIITETGGTDFFNSIITGTLTVNATGNISNGLTAATRGRLDVTGATSLLAPGFNINILPAGQTQSTFGTLTLSGVNINITEHNAADLGAVVATGNFTLTVLEGVAQPAPLGGGITQQGGTIVNVTGVATFDAFGKYNVNLPNANEFGSLIFSGVDVTINEANVAGNGTILGARSSTTSTLGHIVYDDLNLTSAGSITQTAVAAQTFGKLVVQGTASIQSGAGTVITLDRLDPVSPLVGAPNAVANQFGILQLTTTGAATADVTVLEAGATNLGTTNLVGDLTLTATGQITDSGVLTIAGATILNAGTNTIVLDSEDGTFNHVPTNNLQGPISLTGTGLILKNAAAGGTVLGAITATGNFDVYSTTAISNPTLAISVGGKGFFTTTADAAQVPDTVDLGTTAAANFGSLSVVGATNLTLDEGSATALGPITITGNLDVDSTGNITDVGRILVTGSTIVETTAGVITLDTSNNNFDVGGSGDDFVFTATGNVTIVDSASGIEFGTSSGLTLTVTAVGGDVTQQAATTLTIGAGAGAVSVTALGNDIVLTGANSYGTLTLKGATATINDIAALSIGPSTIQLNNARGALTLTAAGDVTQTGAILAGATSITAGANQILLTNAGNRLGAITTVSGTNVSYRENEGVILGATNANGSLTVVAVGSTSAASPVATISQTGAIDANATSLNASPAGAITLNNAGNSFGTLTMIGSSISITEDNNTTNGGAAGTALGATTASASLTVNADGAVTTVGTLTVQGLASVTTTGDQVDLGTATASFGSVSVLGSAAANVTIIEGSATNLATVVTTTGSLTVTSAGAITDSGLIDIGGTTTLSAGLGLAAVTLNTSTNDFTGLVTFNGTNVILVDTNAIDLNTSATVTTLAVDAGGAITQTGDLDVTGATTFDAGTGNNITLTDAGNTFGTLTLIGADVDVTDSTAVELAASTITGPFDLIAGGAVTQTGSINGGTAPLTATGAVNINANAGASAITLTATNNSFGALTLNGSDVSIREAAPIAVAGITASGTVLSLHSTASPLLTTAITQTGTITIAAPLATTTLTATGTNRNIDLQDAANVFGALTISGNDVTLVENDGALGTEVTTASITGDLDIDSTGFDISSTGSVNVAGTVTLDAGAGNITFGSTGSNFGDVLTLTGTNISITEAGATDLGAIAAAGSLDIASGGAINDFGVITVGTTSSFSTAHPALAAGAAITLDQASSYTGAVSLAGTNVSLINAVIAVSLDTVIVTGTLTVSTTNDAISDAGGSISVTGIANFNAGTAAITFNTGSTAFSTVQLTASAATITGELDDIDLGTSTVTGNLAITALGTGDITDSGTLLIGGTATLIAAGDNIVLNSALSQFGTAAAATADFVITAGTVSIRDAGPVELGTILVTVGDFTVTSGLGGADDITDVGATTITVTGFTTFNAGLGDVIITNAGHTFTGGRVGIGASVNIIP